MVFEKDEVLIYSQNKKLLKLYITFVIIDIVVILLMNKIFGEQSVLGYTYIRAVFISISVGTTALKYLFSLSRKLFNTYKVIFIEDDLYLDDEEDDVLGDSWITIKNMLKVMFAIIEVSILFGAQAKAIIHFRESFFDAGVYNILTCLILMGTLLYLTRSYINKKYCM